MVEQSSQRCRSGQGLTWLGVSQVHRVRNWMATRAFRELIIAEKTKAPAETRRPVKPYACQRPCQSESGLSGHSLGSDLMGLHVR